MNIENNELKYNCDKCNFHTNIKSMWEKHILSGKHTTGIRSTRSDKKLLDQCPDCDYKPKSYVNMRHHILNFHSKKEDRKKEFTFYCENCDFGAFVKHSYDKHLVSDKHKKTQLYKK
jgi:hypothetical protein